MINNLENLAGKVCSIALEAGAKILDIYHNASDVEIQKKSDDSPLTVADREANAIICKGLEAISDYPIVSEENKAIPYETRKHFEYSWLVDPLDGTKEFIKRNGEFTVNIALVYNQQPILGVVYAPCLEEMYWATKGNGAYMQKGDTVTRLEAKTFSMKDEGLGVVCSRSHLNDETQAFVDALTTPNLVAKGSSLKFLILAKGEAHLYPRLAPTMEWDTGAAQIVVEEAGGQVIDNNTKKPLLYNKEDLLNPYFVAYGNQG